MNKTLIIVCIVLGFATGMEKLCAQSFGWAKQFTGNSNTQGFEITTDLSGNIFSAGIFAGTMDFDPGPGTFNMTAVWNGDIYISKLDSGGNFVWATSFQGMLPKDVSVIETDSSGNVYIAGTFSGMIDFDPGVGVFNLAGTNSDIFICKLNPAGNFVWAVKMGGLNSDACWSLAIDPLGNVITTGEFSGIADFDPGSGIFNLTAPVGSLVAFVSKLDVSGNFMWAKSFITTSLVTSKIIETDILGNIYTSGWFNQSVDFDPGSATFTLTSSGGKDIFLSKLDAGGNFLWAKKISGVADEESTAMHVDPTGFICLTGLFRGTTDFDPGAGSYNLTSTGNPASFVAKLDPYGNLYWAKAFSVDLVLESTSITIDHLSNVIVAGKILGIADVNPDTVSFYINSPFLFNGFVCSLNASGSFRWAHQLKSLTDNNQINSLACDQYGNMILTGKFSGGCDFDPGQGTMYMYSFTSYNAFVWKLDQCNLTTSTLTDTGCLSYLSPSGNNTWTSSGIYNDIIPSASGCDSILTINLTIITVDTSLTVNSTTLTANAVNASYQWINCISGNIPGATSQNFTAITNGNYAVIVTQNGCTDTSQCISLTSVALTELSYFHKITYYPNPVHDRLQIEWGINLPEIRISVFDYMGKIIFSKYVGAAVMTDIEFPYAPGFYLVQVSSSNMYQTAFKISKL